MQEKGDGDGNRMERNTRDAAWKAAFPEHIAGLDALVDKAAGNNMRAVVPL